MQLSRFIATRLSWSSKKSFSRFIVRIATVAVALSVAVMLIATAMVSGFQETISNKVFGFWGHIQISKYDRNYSYQNSPIDLDSTLERKISNIDGIRNIQPFITKPGILKENDQIEGLILKGVMPGFNWDFLKTQLVAGDTLTLPPDSMSFDIIVSQTTADRLQLSLNQSIQLNFLDPERMQLRSRRLTITGIYHTGVVEYDKLFALVDGRQLQRLNGWNANQIGGYEVFVNDINRLDPLAEQVYKKVPYELDAMTIRQIKPTIFDWLNLQTTNEVLLIILMILVAVVNMITALLILILERTNMIGILKAIGGNNGFIQRIFLWQAGYILLVGLFWGNLLGLGLAILQQQFGFITLQEDVYYVHVAPVHLEPLWIIGINVGTLLVTLLILWLPSLLVGRIQPIRAIRFA